MFHWTAKQTYPALSNAMNACAELQIDCTPMEGFKNHDYNQKLGLKEKGSNPCVVLAIGYRNNEDTKILKKS
jgi:nitroreductase/dihydropteridine reductase